MTARVHSQAISTGSLEHLNFREIECPLTDHTTTDELRRILHYVPDAAVPLVDYFLHEIEEIKLDAGSPISLRIGNAHIDYNPVISAEEIENLQKRIGGFKSNNRKGIDSTMHRLHKGVDGFGGSEKLTYRMAHLLTGQAVAFADLLGEQVSVGIAGPPNSGKTTFMRDMILEDAKIYGRGLDVVDTNNELCGEGRKHPKFDRIRQWKVKDPDELAMVMNGPLRSGGTVKTYCDEVGYQKSDVQLIRNARLGGVIVTCSVHGRSVMEAIWKPELWPLFGVTLNEMGELRRVGPPTFEKFIEMPKRGIFLIHHDLERSIRDIVDGKTPEVEAVRLHTRIVN